MFRFCGGICAAGLLLQCEPPLYSARPEALRHRGAELLILARGVRRESQLRASAHLGQPCQEGVWLGRTNDTTAPGLAGWQGRVDPATEIVVFSRIQEKTLF